MTQLLLQVPDDRQGPWLAALATRMPELEIVVWPDISTDKVIDYALLWQPPSAVFDATKQTSVFFSLGAGVDHLMPHLERIGQRPIVRMVDPILAEGMAEYVIYYVLKFHRQMQIYEKQQRTKTWKVLSQTSASDRHVGVLGLGVIGGHIARTLTSLGFVVHGYSRTGKAPDGVIAYSGDDGLRSLAEQVDILINVLPLAEQTRGILSSQLFWQMKRGSFVINIGRGSHLVEQDLVDACHSGQICGAALDVFTEEPLPCTSPLWHEPGIFVTPHVASLTQPTTASRHIVDNIQRHRDGGDLWPVFDREHGY